MLLFTGLARAPNLCSAADDWLNFTGMELTRFKRQLCSVINVTTYSRRETGKKLTKKNSVFPTLKTYINTSENFRKCDILGLPRGNKW